MKFLIFFLIWLILRVISHIVTGRSKGFGRDFYRGLYVSIGIDLLFLFILFYGFLKIRVLFSYLFSINLLTLFYYGLDKYLAIHRGFRIPEKVLLGLSFAGGSIGALLGMYIFHHKTKKLSFQIWFWILILLQIVVVYLIYRYVLR